MNWQRLKKLSPNVFALMGLLFLLTPALITTLYKNIFFATGLLCFFLAWCMANILKTNNVKDWQKLKKTIIGMGLCVAVGFSLLCYYEMKMPKYQVVKINKELYRVPPQLSKKQLIELGRECNTYGNTLCSHDVFAKIVQLDPRDYQSLANLAMAQSHLGFHQYAVANFKRALENGAKAYDILKFYGDSLKVLKRNKEAIQAYQASLELNPHQNRLVEKIEKLQAN